LFKPSLKKTGAGSRSGIIREDRRGCGINYSAFSPLISRR
jgi:hypothetical protein